MFVLSYRCGFYVTGWVKGSHPETLGEMKDAKVCFNYADNECYWSNSIKILNCDSYFLYELPDTPGCSLGYCSIEWKELLLLVSTVTPWINSEQWDMGVSLVF